jgi:Lon protease-like protein
VSAQPLIDQDLDELAIFPLHEAALFPNTVVPLHVFEPRYRQLVEHCLEQDRPLAVWQLDPGGPASAFGPGIRRVATAGRIAVHHAMPDGRYNVVVEGVERVAFLEEVESPALYRTVRTRRHPLSPVDVRAVQARLEALKGIAVQLLPVHPRAARLVDVTLGRTDDPEEISDVLCSVTFEDGGARQLLLEQSDVNARLDRVIESLSNTLLRDLPETPDGEHPAPPC